MAVEANSDGEYDYLEAEEREQAADNDVISILDDSSMDEQHDRHQEDEEQQQQQQQDEDEEEEEEEEEEYDYQDAVNRSREEERDGGDNGSEMSQESNYEYEMSDGEAGVSTQGKDLAEADADAFVEESDGMFARVETPSTHLVRVWIGVKPWRLYEGLGSRTVEALGLDPSKGVMVMLTTDQYYTLSSKCPGVKWLRQVAPDKMHAAAKCSDGSVGDTFSLQWMLRKRLEEGLSQNWPPRSRYADEEEDEGGPDRAGGGIGGGGGGTGQPRGGAGAGDPNMEATRSAIEAICDCTAVSAELAAYALQFSQFDSQLAQNNLLDEAMRASLEMTLAEDRAAAVVELKRTFSHVEEAVILRAVAAHPGALHRQRDYVCRAEAGEQQRPPPSSPPPRRSSTSAGKSRSRRSGTSMKLRTRGSRRGGSSVARASEGGAAGGGGGGSSGQGKRGWEGAAGDPDSGFMPLDLTEDEEIDDRRALLEHLSDKNLLLRVAHAMIDKLRNANNKCLVCDDKIEGFLPAVPIVCQKDLCVMSSEEMGCGTDVESQVLRKGETVDLLIDLFWMAMKNESRSELAFPAAVQSGSALAFKKDNGTHDVEKVRTVLDVFPSVADMQRCIESQAKGGTAETSVTNSSSSSSSSNSGVGTNAAASGAGSSASAGAAAPDPRTAQAKATATSLARKAAAAAATVLSRYRGSGGGGGSGGGSGSVVTAAGAAEEKEKEEEKKEESAWDQSVAQMLSLRQALTEMDQLSYPLLRWLLSANRAHLRPLRGSELIPEIPCEKQFMLVTGTAEREAKFQKMKRIAGSRRSGGSGTGSFYAFHGSKPDNWHGILHMGLRNMSGTKYQSYGASYGKGIYMAEALGVSLKYAGMHSNGEGSGSHWPLSYMDGSAVIVAVCEVIDKEECRQAHGPKYYVVPDEECVATRYLLINPKLSDGVETKITAGDLTIPSHR